MKNLWISIKFTLAMCVVLFVGYVLVLRLVAWVASPNDGEAALVEYNGKVVGAANVGQAFTDSVYFWGRPSNVDYNGGGSGGSNKATTNPEYLAQVEERVDAFLAAHPYLSREEVPAEMVTASGSGLDPDISAARGGGSDPSCRRSPRHVRRGGEADRGFRDRRPLARPVRHLEGERAEAQRGARYRPEQVNEKSPSYGEAG